jgi:ABC-2 type transport system ATP-binding protein
VIATHQVEEIQDILTDVMFVHRGKLLLTQKMEAVQERYVELVAAPERAAQARALQPLREREVLGRHFMLFDGVERGALADFGEVRTPSLADLFITLVTRADAAAGVPA